MKDIYKNPKNKLILTTKVISFKIFNPDGVGALD